MRASVPRELLVVVTHKISRLKDHESSCDNTLKTFHEILMRNS